MSSPQPLRKFFINTPEHPLPPVITVTPATFTVNCLRTPPLTATSSSTTGTALPSPTSVTNATTTAPRPILKTKISTTPIADPLPSLNFNSYQSHPPSLTFDPMNPHPSLHTPLKRHLGLLHPSTPSEILHFCATRLLSTDRPHGHKGEWVPVWREKDGVEFDLCALGLGLEAGKGCAQKQKGKGREMDERLERMYDVARESWRRLEEVAPGVNKC